MLPGKEEQMKTPMACSDNSFLKELTLLPFPKKRLLLLSITLIIALESASTTRPHMKSFLLLNVVHFELECTGSILENGDGSI